MNQTPEFSVFLQELSRVLRDLYNPMTLQKSPLQGYFNLEKRVDPISALRDALIEAIQQIKPDPKVPVDSVAYRYYQILLFRFVQQSSQKEVAADFALSIRQLRRSEKQALRFLADSLISRHGPFEATPEMLQGLSIQSDADDDESATESEGSLTGSAEVVESVSAPGMPNPEEELAWLQQSSDREMIDIANLLESAIQTVQPLLRAKHLEVILDIAPNLPPALGQATALRHALIHTFIAASTLSDASSTGNAQPHTLRATLSTAGSRLHLQLSAPVTVERASAIPAPFFENLQSAAQLLALFGGTLTGPNQAQPGLVIDLYVPAIRTLRVLAVDDHQDVLLLLGRYCSGTRYEFFSTHDPTQAIALAEAHDAQIIVIDVMLPGVDGWELLGRMRAHPRLQHVPVLVCSILPQESLAMVLGAAGFVRKPVSRESFLAALEQLAGLLDRAAH